MLTKKQIRLYIQQEFIRKFLSSYYKLSADHRHLDPHRFETLQVVNEEYEIVMSYVPGALIK